MTESITAENATQTVVPNEPQQKKLKSKKKFNVIDVIIWVFLGLFSVFCMLPLLYVVLLSFSTEPDYHIANFFVIPYHFHFENYKANILAGFVMQSFGNTIFLTVVKTIYQMLLTSFGAYAFTRKDVPGIRFFFTLFVIPMFVGGGLLPFYATVQATTGLNTLWALILPFGLSGFNMIVLRNFFSAVPEEMIESCRLDGASDLRILFQFILPLSGAGLATIALFYMVDTWNEWYWASMFIRNMELYPLAFLVRQALHVDGSLDGTWKGAYDASKTYGEGLNAAMTILALLPILLVYPILQKYFTKGVMIGSVKG